MLEKLKPKILIYTTPKCHQCQKAKEYLTSKGYVFREINVFESREKSIEMIEKSKQSGVPVLEINEKIIIGFNPQKIDELLETKNI